MTFRRATIHDAALLYAWRQTDEHANAYPTPTTVAAHKQWLRERLNTHLVTILIWEEHGTALGMVRRDSNDELAYHATTNDVAARMLAAVVAECDESGRRLKITLDADDPKRGQLEAAGFVVYPAVFLAYKP